MLQAPFKQLPFTEVPDKPRISHPYFNVKSQMISFHSKPFGNVNLHLKTYGSGPPLLLVHGFMTTGYSWRYMIEPLGQHFTLYIPDLVGSGLSSKPEASYDPDSMAEFLHEMVRNLNIFGCRAIGNSLGGYLCMRAVLKFPGIFSRLVNLHSPGISTGRMQVLRFALGMFPFSETVVRTLVNRNPEKWVHTNVHYYDESLKSKEEHREYSLPLKTPEGVHAFYLMLKQTLNVKEMQKFEKDLLSLNGYFPIPLLLVYAKKDPMVPPAVGKKMHRILPKVEFHWLDRGSHFAHVDATDLFVEKALPFLMAT
ncbi:hypothetical protein CH373_06405 [Leptospira perolatii]|uniref:AB hydrolase-1 domain-containing protein n=1 Tax=Leptospira perolatii TaxID=2023191 RepID=A0A2M9ZNX5_9LEPT|nr:alpha/beta hydrolase [Leptospira perolatii]PJZ70892.1 hypothetical protein CH360_05135 [Leptospira perolatii]PJZ73788.1 hypothetical protein CH373_06405 [Leptospira perolatii]